MENLKERDQEKRILEAKYLEVMNRVKNSVSDFKIFNEYDIFETAYRMGYSDGFAKATIKQTKDEPR